MKLQIMSDLHFEMHADGGAGLIRELDPTGVDVLVLAGDITMARHYANLESVFKPLAKKYRHILYVPGNHEYYKSSPTEVARNLAKLTKALPQVVIPENDAVVIAGRRFIAGTMWFRADPAAEPNKRFMHDFSLIQDFEPWVYEQNAAFERVLATRVRADDVVVTHHLPAFESVPERFARSVMNAFFVCDMAPRVRERQPKLWIHGHSHAATTGSARRASSRTRSAIRTRSRAWRRSSLRSRWRSNLAMPPSKVPMEVIRRELAARVTAMFERWAADDISDEPEWDIDQIERLGFRHDARATDS